MTNFEFLFSCFAVEANKKIFIQTGRAAANFLSRNAGGNPWAAHSFSVLFLPVKNNDNRVFFHKKTLFFMWKYDKI